MMERDTQHLQMIARLQTLRGQVLDWEQLRRAAAQDADAALEAELARRRETIEAVWQMLCRGRGARDEQPLLHLFRRPHDCRNAKVLLRAMACGAEAEPLLSHLGTVDAGVLRAALAENKPGLLPPWLRVCVAQARSVQKSSQRWDLTDAALERGTFMQMDADARASGCPAAQEGLRLLADGINTQTLLRCAQWRKEDGRALLLPLGSLAPEHLPERCAPEEVAARVHNAALRAAARTGDAGQVRWALWGQLTALARRCARSPFGADALLGFCLELKLYAMALRWVQAAPREEKRRAEVFYG